MKINVIYSKNKLNKSQVVLLDKLTPQHDYSICVKYSLRTYLFGQKLSSYKNTYIYSYKIIR